MIKADNSFAATYNGFKYSISNKKVTITGYTGSNTSVTIPSKIKGYTVTKIGSEAFESNKKIKSVTMPNSINWVGDFSFEECSNLTSIKMSNSVTYIGGQAFSGCSSLKSIIIPNKVTYIGPWAFSGCSNLTSITIPKSVSEISDYPFSYCPKLNNIYVYENSYAYRRLKLKYSSKVKIIQAPSTPKVSLTSGKNKITIKWNPVSQASGYQIYRSTSKTGTYSLLTTISSSSASSCLNNGLKTGKTYYYKVRAYKVYAGVRVYGNFSSVKYAKVK